MGIVQCCVRRVKGNIILIGRKKERKREERLKGKQVVKYFYFFKFNFFKYILNSIFYWMLCYKL